MRLKKGDNVIVIAGKNKGKTGKVTLVLREVNRVVVEGVNKLKKNLKTQKKGADTQIEFDAPFHASNVMLIDPKTNKRTRVGVKKVDGKNIRITKKSGTELK